MGARISRSISLSSRPVMAVDGSGSGSNARDTAAVAIALAGGGQNSTGYMPELYSYEAACRLDPELQSFDTSLQRQTSRILSNLASGVEVRALSLDSLREVTGSLLEMNQEVVKIILECKKDIWKNPQLFDLVEEYFDNSIQTLDFCTSLEKCLNRARDSQLILQIALGCFAEENAQEAGEDGLKQYTKTMEELRLFKAAGDPFTEEFLQVLQSVQRQQLLMLEKLQRRKNKLDKRIKTIQSWRRVSSIIFAVTVTAIIICSVVAAAISAPPVAAALAAGASVPLGSMGRWIESLLKNYQDTMKEHREVLSSMQVATYITVKDLDDIRAQVDNLEIQIGALLDDADFALRDSEAMKIGFEEIKKKSDLFMRSIEDLGQRADKCSRDIRQARTVVLQKIIKQPN